jgi:peptidoglycan endopeptidase LytE
VLALRPGQLAAVDDASRTLALPQVTGVAQEVLRTAVSLIGYPYVWAGTSETAGPGFDCSGYVWRVFKGRIYADAPALGATIAGRSTEAMSGEMPAAARIPLTAIRPADILFFGTGPGSKPKDVGHAGIYLGGGWFVHASSQGVSLAQLDGGYRTTFAWARRPLAEAGVPGSTG